MSLAKDEYFLMSHRPAFNYDTIGRLPYWKFKLFVGLLVDDLKNEQKVREDQRSAQETNNKRSGFGNAMSRLSNLIKR